MSIFTGVDNDLGLNVDEILYFHRFADDKSPHNTCIMFKGGERLLTAATVEQVWKSLENVEKARESV